MNLSVNPKEFQSLKIGTPQEQSKFLFKLTQILSEMSSAISNLQIMTLPNIINLGTVSTNQTVTFQNPSFALVVFNYTAAITIALKNLTVGVPVIIIFTNTSAGALILQLTAALPGGTAYTSITTKLAGAASGFGNNWITGVSNGSNVGNVLYFQSYLSAGNAVLQGFNA